MIKGLLDKGLVAPIVQLASKPTHFSLKWRLDDLEVSMIINVATRKFKFLCGLYHKIFSQFFIHRFLASVATLLQPRRRRRRERERKRRRERAKKVAVRRRKKGQRVKKQLQRRGTLVVVRERRRRERVRVKKRRRRR